MPSRAPSTAACKAVADKEWHSRHPPDEALGFQEDRLVGGEEVAELGDAAVVTEALLDRLVRLPSATGPSVPRDS